MRYGFNSKTSEKGYEDETIPLLICSPADSWGLLTRVIPASKRDGTTFEAGLKIKALPLGSHNPYTVQEVVS